MCLDCDRVVVVALCFMLAHAEYFHRFIRLYVRTDSDTQAHTARSTSCCCRSFAAVARALHVFSIIGKINARVRVVSFHHMRTFEVRSSGFPLRSSPSP